MNISAKQLAFSLEPPCPYSLSYFVGHSGVVKALSCLERVITELAGDPSAFKSVFLFGLPGTGKTHILMGACEKAVSLGMSEDMISYVRIAEEPDDCSGSSWASAFVADYECLRSTGGLLLIEASGASKDVSSNPHVQSRLLAGEIVEVKFPREEELRPLLQSLLERKNLKISEYCLEYILRRLPRDTLSFEHIFASISALSFSETRPAGLSVVKQVVEQTLGNKS